MKSRQALKAGKILSDKTNLNTSMSWSNRLRDKKGINFHESTLSTENDDSHMKENTQTNDEPDTKKIPIYLRENKLLNAKENKSPERCSNIYQFELDANEPVNNKKGRGTKRKKTNKEDEELEKIEKRFKSKQNNILKEIKKQNIKSKTNKVKIQIQENINKKNILPLKNLQPLLPNQKTQNKNIVLKSTNLQPLLPLKKSIQEAPNKTNIELKTKMTGSQGHLKEFNQDKTNCMNISLPLSINNQNIEKSNISPNGRQGIKSIENTPNSLDKINMSTSQRPTFISPSPNQSSINSCNNFPITPHHVSETPNFADITPIKNPQVAFHSTPVRYPATSTPFHITEYSRIPQLATPRRQPHNISLPNTSSIHTHRSLSRLMDSRESSLQRSMTVISVNDSNLFGFDSESIPEETHREKLGSSKKEDLKDLKIQLFTKIAPLIKPIPKEEDENNYDNNCDYEQSFLESSRINDKPKLKQKKINQLDFNSLNSSCPSSFSYQNQSFVNDSPHIFEEDPPHSHTKPPRKSYQREKKQVRFVGCEVMSAEEIDFEDDNEENQSTIDKSMDSFEHTKKKIKKKSKQDKINDKLIKEMKKQFSEVDDYELVIE